MALISYQPDSLSFQLPVNVAPDAFLDALFSTDSGPISLHGVLTTGQQTALFCAIVLALIPLAIWAFCNLDNRRHGIQDQRGQKPVRAKSR